ncbi:unnamed protein product [Polarella glacialis]|uniref:Methyltransferase type 11 domain-containing protein n=1 Tax=Polarella glacialis TaxID=89957 RepID=A0A813DIN9_POLGL|nr:unnamed protein product [Polarella glacialis]CAE8661593.1 unnamed protein product [Polarella glacialis]
MEDAYDEGVAYWDKRYLEEPKPSDWILKPKQLSEVLAKLVPRASESKILHVGCGNSLLPEEMHDDGGCKQQVNIDTSAVVIQQMQARNSELRPQLQWLVMDATAMDFPDEHFDVVIDKGTLDTILCEDDEDHTMVAAYLREVTRVMASGGVFVAVTFGPPEDRMKYFVPRFSVETIEVPATNVKISHCQWVYACRKGNADFTETCAPCRGD